jgi:hypothetical protein
MPNHFSPLVYCLGAKCSSFHIVGMLSTDFIRCTFHLLQLKPILHFFSWIEVVAFSSFKDHIFFTNLHYGVLGFSKQTLKLSSLKRWPSPQVYIHYRIWQLRIQMLAMKFYIVNVFLSYSININTTYPY